VLTVTVRVGGRDAIARAVATGELDAGFVDGVAAAGDPLRLPATGIRMTSSREEPLAVAVASDHPLVGRAAALEDLLDARWIDAPEIAAPLAELAAVARADGFRPALRYDGQDVRGLLALVAAGHGLALLPERALVDGVAGLPLTSPPLIHRTELLRLGG
jgi:DNA-binding transcriptional LysR family regulator